MGKALSARARRVPVEIVAIRTPDGAEQRIPRVPLGEVLGQPDVDLQRVSEQVARCYWETVRQGRVILSQIGQQRRPGRRVSPHLYWKLGDLLLRYSQENDKSEVFLNGVKPHFLRDLPLSRAAWEKILRFRTLVPSSSQIDPSKDWSFYRDAPSVAVEIATRFSPGRADRARSRARERLEVRLPEATLRRLLELTATTPTGRRAQPAPGAIASALLVAAAAMSEDPSEKDAWLRLRDRARRILGISEKGDSKGR